MEKLQEIIVKNLDISTNLKKHPDGNFWVEKEDMW
jgi:hypothetical protein